MYNILIVIGHIFMVSLAIASLVSSILVIRIILKSQELKDIKNIRRELENNAYLIQSSGSLVPKGFICEQKDIDDSSQKLKKLEIDDIYQEKNL